MLALSLYPGAFAVTDTRSKSDRIHVLLTFLRGQGDSTRDDHRVSGDLLWTPMCDRGRRYPRAVTERDEIPRGLARWSGALVCRVCATDSAHDPRGRRRLGLFDAI